MPNAQPIMREILPRRSLIKLGRDEQGAIAIKFALIFPIFITFFFFGLDYARYMREQAALQEGADSAAMASAKELSLSDRKHENLPEIAQAMVAGWVRRNPERIAKGSRPTTKTTVSKDPVEVEVVATFAFNSMFDHMLGITFPPVSARAVARVVGQPNICVLGLNPDEGGTISLEHDARVTGRNCAVYSNSTHNNGLKSKNDANLSASTICSRGGKDGGPGNFSPQPILDCPSFDDPLLSRPEPAAEPCDVSRPVAITSDETLNPGTYCGLEIRNGARVTLREGIYVFKDKPLIVKDGGQLFGEGTGLFFTGNNATFTFERLSSISLTAPTTGAMAGLLIFTSRSQGNKLSYKILSDDARVMVGTIYIPVGEFHIDATNPIADQSAYTAIVADKMRLYGGPHLILNTNYTETDVPVPEGIRGAGQPVVLSR
ncbi:MAG: TadE/TadG family type IV pilus assembly protein [Hyphomicrobium sp.]